MELFAPVSIFTLLIGLAMGLTALFSLALLYLFIKDWSNSKIW